MHRRHAAIEYRKPTFSANTQPLLTNARALYLSLWSASSAYLSAMSAGEESVKLFCSSVVTIYTIVGNQLVSNMLLKGKLHTNTSILEAVHQGKPSDL